MKCSYFLAAMQITGLAGHYEPQRFPGRSCYRTVYPVAWCSSQSIFIVESQVAFHQHASKSIARIDKYQIYPWKQIEIHVSVEC
jgi:hypothetical protein